MIANICSEIVIVIAMFVFVLEYCILFIIYIYIIHVNSYLDCIKNKNVKFITPLGVTSHMKKWGINEANLLELDWWDSIKLKDITFVCTPSRHYSGRLVSWKTSKT